MFTRKIGKFLRGNATPFQIISATVLGGLVGSLPGFGQSPLLMVLLLFLMIVLNANLLLAGLSLLLFKTLYLVLLPLYFHAGVFLLESPIGGLVSVFVNAPVTAWFGLEHYVVLPGILIGFLGGFFLGCWISRSLKAFRRRMASLETGSERYQAYTAKPWVRFLAWLTVGGIRGKKGWSELGDQRKGLPVRPLGIIFVISLAVLGFVGWKLLDQTIVTTVVRDNLERANGATVDIASVEILPAQNRVIISGLAMADPEALKSNRFQAETITADISGANLLAKRLVIDSIRVERPATGAERRLVGQRTADVPPLPEDSAGEGEVSLDDYLGQAAVWRERLATMKRLYERVAPYLEKEDPAEAVEGEAPPTVLSWRERLAQRAQELGYANIKADSLIEGFPQLVIRDLQADNLDVANTGDKYAIFASNLSSQPALMTERGQLRVERADGNFDLTLTLPGAEAPATSSLAINLRDLSVAELQEQAGRDLPMKGGTLSISGSGSITNAVLDVPLKVTFKGSTLNAFGTSLPLDGIPLEVRLAGPMESPKLDLPTEALQEAAMSAGRKKVEGLIQEKAGEQIRKLLPFGG